VVIQSYLYYLLKDKINLLQNQTHGSVFDTITRDTFANIEINLPEIDEQRSVANILSALDDKIAINKRINRHLEQMAQAIFKSWFIDFEPWSGVMPDDWHNGILRDICSYNNERVAVSTLTLDTYISTENMISEKAGFVVATSLPKTSKTTAFAKGDTLISNIRPYFKKIVYSGFAGGCSTDVLCFRPNKTNLSHYVFNILYNDKFFDYMVIGSNGTKMPRGNKEHIMNYPVTIPADLILDNFMSVVAPMIDMKLILMGETNKLAVLRDSLLPRLMSGEISVTKSRH